MSVIWKVRHLQDPAAISYVLTDDVYIMQCVNNASDSLSQVELDRIETQLAPGAPGRRGASSRSPSHGLQNGLWAPTRLTVPFKKAPTDPDQEDDVAQKGGPAIDAAEPTRTRRRRGEDSRQRIKDVAVELFSVHSMNEVSTRDIIKASGLRNENAIQYYFGSKEGLLREIILDFGRDIESDFNRRVDEMEAAGGPKSAREVLRIYTQFPGSIYNSSTKKTRSINYFENIAVNYTDFLIDVVESEGGFGSKRCLDHLRPYMSHLPNEIIHERLALMNLFVIAGLTSREAAGKRPRGKRGLWGRPTMYETFLDCLEGMLFRPTEGMDAPLTDEISRTSSPSSRKARKKPAAKTS